MSHDQLLEEVAAKGMETGTDVAVREPESFCICWPLGHHMCSDPNHTLSRVSQIHSRTFFPQVPGHHFWSVIPGAPSTASALCKHGVPPNGGSLGLLVSCLLPLLYLCSVPKASLLTRPKGRNPFLFFCNKINHFHVIYFISEYSHFRVIFVVIVC